MQKSTLTLLVGILLVTFQNSKAQEFYGENPEECKQRLSILSTYYKQKAYRDAAPSFRYLLNNCPRASKNIYIIGNKVMETLIKEEKDKELKLKYVDTLLLIQDLRLKYFPGKKPNRILAKKGVYLLKYKLKTHYPEAFTYLNSAFQQGPTELKAYDLYMYMYAYKIMVKSKKKSCEEMIGSYLTTTSLIAALEKSGTKIKDKTKNKINEYGEVCLNCNLLDSLYQKDFEKRSNDTLWLDNGINLLTKKKCNTSTALLLMMEKRFSTKPTAQIAFTLGRYYLNKQDLSTSKTYIDQAIELEKTDSNKMSNYHHLLSKYYIAKKNYSSAFYEGLKAIKLNNNNFKAYMSVGNSAAYQSANCQSLTFEGKELFWLAVDYYKKALSIAQNDKQKKKANNSISKYKKYFPENGKLFMKSLKEGSSYQINCTISGSTTVRSKK